MHAAFAHSVAVVRLTSGLPAAAATSSASSSFLSSLRAPRSGGVCTPLPTRRAVVTPPAPAMGLFDAIKNAGASLLSQPEPMQVVRWQRLCRTHTVAWC